MPASKPVVYVTQSTFGLGEDEDLTLVHAPLITTEILPFDESLLEEHYTWLVMTSKNTVKHFLPFFERVKTEHISSIGVKTTEALNAHGIDVDFEPSTYTQEGFIEECTIHPGDKILYPASSKKRPLMRDYMRKCGGEVTEIELYYPKVHEGSIQKIRENLDDIDYLTLSSPSAVDSLMGHFTPDELQSIHFIAIGHVTESRLNQYGLTASKPEHETLGHMINFIKESME
ncbi:uroporphyrinogen-III synthase [Jeotgalicoccus saudimassiliensis]|uniref:Uroporphyrinogen-III synthase n=1 Tax=Jeotgalicoccus saudimassiliensis TaxID=1461582 RepID=A0A078M7A1_9STAP|nr:uroporphyrinogen-III synthase [Jeotgalicoccus saudimassiliensis]CEA00576.1 uroporphyrinogen-III synthase [Jeotgalicoccus saudimassiliensis]